LIPTERMRIGAAGARRFGTAPGSWIRRATQITISAFAAARRWRPERRFCCENQACNIRMSQAVMIAEGAM